MGPLCAATTRWVPVPYALGISTVIFALVHEHNTGDTIQLLAVGAMARGCTSCTAVLNPVNPQRLHAPGDPSPEPIQ
jgi:hypothetical protein